jgi:hypothetical protein
MTMTLVKYEDFFLARGSLPKGARGAPIGLIPRPAKGVYLGSMSLC